MIIKADDPQTMFVGNGDFIPGVTGAVQVTRDGGANWEKADLPCRAQLRGLLAGQQPRDAQRRGRRQPLRLRLRQRGRRQHVEQAPEGVRRNPRPGSDAQLTPAFPRKILGVDILSAPLIRWMQCSPPSASQLGRWIGGAYTRPCSSVLFELAYFLRRCKEITKWQQKATKAQMPLHM